MIDRETLVQQLADVGPDDVAQALVGVPLHTIETIERALRITFPGIYRAFLEAMGEDTGPFNAVGASHSTRMSELLAVVPGPQERTSRYWRISIERHLMQDQAVDYYLDLSKSDGADAELVAFEHPPDSPLEIGTSLGLTFYEHLRVRMFHQYVTAHPSAHYSVHVSRRTPDELAALQQTARDVLLAGGFTELHPYPGRVAFFRKEAYAVAVRQFEQTQAIAAFIEGSTPLRALEVSERLRDYFPDDARTRRTKR